MRSLVVLALALAAAPLSAQDLPHQVVARRSAVGPPPQAAPRRPAEDAVLSTVGAGLGGVAGFYAVGLAGYYLTGGGRICGDDACGFAGGILGALLGEAVGIGVGAHLGGGRRGDILAPIGASLGVLIAAGMVAGAVELPEEAVVVVPIVQVAAAVWAAVRT